MITEAELDSMLANTSELLKNVHYFDCKLHSIPGSSHRGATITHVDLVERRDDFVRELRNTLCAWVYSKPKYRAIFEEELAARNQDFQNAAAHIERMAREKFRSGFPQGQFGELLLFNLIQYFFKAPPVLRKMPITTNPSIERHGADAIHYRLNGNQHHIFIGEAKSYKSKYKFSAALEDAIDGIFKAHQQFHSELGLYVYEDFIDEPLRSVAKAIKRNELAGVKHELVCVISYAETKGKTGPDEASIKAAIEEILAERMKSFDGKVFAGKDKNVADRIHYFLLPFWNFDQLLAEFES